MVFRRDNKGGDAFQKQISQLRQQLGGAGEDEDEFEDEPGRRQEFAPDAYTASRYQEEPQYSGVGDDLPYDSRTDVAPVGSYEPQLPAIPVADAQMTVVSQNTRWKGEITSEGSMHVHGQFEGVIRADEDVYILTEASVAAEIRARNVVIAGQYDGEVTCGARFEVLPTGRVTGAVKAPVLVVHDGAQINGSIQMTPTERERTEPTSLVHRRESAGSS
jgi:cytoskeletal protein CcmA (bactofilin family)